MNNDLISRSALLEQVKCDGWYGTCCAACDAIKAAPAVAAAPKWINAKETLPDEGIRVLVSIRYDADRYVVRTGTRSTLHTWMELYKGKTMFYWAELPEPPQR